MKAFKTALITGHFNMLHAGHRRLFALANNLAERVVAGIESDELAGDASFSPQEVRAYNLECSMLADVVLLYDEGIETMVRLVEPDCVIKGSEFIDQDRADLGFLREQGIPVIFGGSRSGPNFFDKKNLAFPLPKNLSTLSELGDRLLEFLVPNERSVTVVGELIVDKFVACASLGLSREDGCIVYEAGETMSFTGGAGIVAKNAKEFFDESIIFSTVGLDVEGDLTLSDLKKSGVTCDNVHQSKVIPTIVKTRYQENGRSIFRLTSVGVGELQTDEEAIARASILASLKKSALIIFSDFNYNVIDSELIRHVIRSAAPEVLIAADSQSSSQYGDITRYKGCDYIFATEHEARIALRDQTSGLTELARQLCYATEAKAIFLKLGPDGVGVFAPVTDRDFADLVIIPTLADQIVDVSGAGDSMLVATSAALVAGASPIEAGWFGSIASKIQVSRLGNVPILRSEFEREISTIFRD